MVCCFLFTIKIEEVKMAVVVRVGLFAHGVVAM